MALLEINNLHVALEDGTEIVKGVDLAVDQNEMHAIMGPNGSGQVDARLRADGPPGLRDHRGRDPLRRRGPRASWARTSARSGGSSSRSSTRTPFPGVTVTSFLRSAINAIRKARAGEDDPVPIPEFRKELFAADGPAQGLARARVALPQRRLLGRREEARRDPADGDAEAARSPCSTRPTPGSTSTRCGSSRAASRSSSARRWARS